MLAKKTHCRIAAPPSRTLVTRIALVLVGLTSFEGQEYDRAYSLVMIQYREFGVQIHTVLVLTVDGGDRREIVGA